MCVTSPIFIKMVCGVSGSIAVMFIIGMVYFYGVTNSLQIGKKYEATLTPEQRTHYNKILSERTRLTYEGYGLGLGISAVYVWLQRSLANSEICKRLKRGKTSVFSMVLAVVAITCVTNYFYYVLSPKNKFMLDYLSDPEDIARWLKMYREMQFNYHMGLLCGVAAAGFGAFAFRWKCK